MPPVFHPSDTGLNCTPHGPSQHRPPGSKELWCPHTLCSSRPGLGFYPIPASTLCQQVSEIPGRCIPSSSKGRGDWPWPPVSSTPLARPGMPRSSWRKFTMVPHFLRYLPGGQCRPYAPLARSPWIQMSPVSAAPQGTAAAHCGPGTFSPLPGADTCLPCPGGYLLPESCHRGARHLPQEWPCPRPTSGDRGTLCMTPMDGAPEGSVQAGPLSPSALLCPGTLQSTQQDHSPSQQPVAREVGAYPCLRAGGRGGGWGWCQRPTAAVPSCSEGSSHQRAP